MYELLLGGHGVFTARFSSAGPFSRGRRGAVPGPITELWCVAASYKQTDSGADASERV